jgi:hypothetical protein
MFRILFAHSLNSGKSNDLNDFDTVATAYGKRVFLSDQFKLARKLSRRRNAPKVGAKAEVWFPSSTREGTFIHSLFYMTKLTVLF